MDYNVQASVPETDISTTVDSSCGLSGDNIVQIAGIFGITAAAITGIVCVFCIPSKNKVGLNCKLPTFSKDKVGTSLGLSIEPAEKSESPKR